MFKEFRNLMQMLDDLGDAGPMVVPSEDEPEAVELPQSVEPAPAAAVAAPMTFLLDPDPAAAGALAAILQGSGLTTEIFSDSAGFVRGLLTRTPSLVFLDVAGSGDDAIDALFAMGERGYGSAVQLIGDDVSPLVSVVRRMGERHSLQMLPSLRKPLAAHAVRRVLNSQNLGTVPAATSATLDEALANGWVEFWYQPKIDLGKRQIAGVETFARVRHPELGTLPPGIFMQGATEAGLLQLTRQALAAALGAAANFSRVGINLRVAANIPVKALLDLPIARMLGELAPRNVKWPGLLLDVTEGQLAEDFARVEAIGRELAAANARLAIDDFGGGRLPLAHLRQLSVAELKLDRGFVNGCADDPARARVCASVIELAHHLGCIAVAVGIERLADMKALTEMGCDLGQGFLFGQPMPEEELVGLLLKRAVAPPRPEPGPAAAPKLKRAVWR